MNGLNIVNCALTVIERNGIVTVDGLFHRYDTAINAYVPVGIDDMQACVTEAFPTMYGSISKNVTDYAISVLKRGDFEAEYSGRYIRFANCVFDTVEKKAREFDKDLYKKVFTYVPCHYDEDVHSEVMEKAIKVWTGNDTEKEELLYQIVGYAMLHRPTLRKAFFLVGPKRSGKSTFLKVVSGMLGKNQVSSVRFESLADRFGLSELPGKCLNVSPDLPAVNLGPKETSIIRSLISYENVSVEYKYRTSFSVRIPVVLLCACNEMPVMDDKFAAMVDRIIPISFDAEFVQAENDDPDFAENLVRDQDAMTYLATKSMNAVLRVLERGEFSIPASSINLIKEIDEKNNPEIAFLAEHEAEHFTGRRTVEVFEEFHNFCSTYGIDPDTSQEELKKIICARFGLVAKRNTVNGVKSTRYILK